MTRRKFIKHLATGSGVVAISTLGLYSILTSRNEGVSTTPLSSSTIPISSMTSISTTKSETTASPLEPLLYELDDPKSGFPQLANAIRKLPDFHVDTEASRNAVKRITSLALESDDSQVKDAFDIMLRGGNSPFWHDNPQSGKSWLSYETPSWNAEIQALYWLGEQTEFKKNDTLALAIAMSHGIFITLGDDDARKAVYADINGFLNYMRNLNNYQKSHNITQIENYPLEAKLALAWRANDLGRFGRVHQFVMNICPEDIYKQFPVPTNIHNFYEFRQRPINKKDYEFVTVSTNSLEEMFQYEISKGWLVKTGNRFAVDTVQNIRGLFGNYGMSSLWVYPRTPYGPCDSGVVIDGELTESTNINNADFVWDRFKKTGKGLGVSDDFNAWFDSLLKSVGIAGVSIDYIWDYNDADASHEETLFYDPSTKTWKVSAFGPLSRNMGVYIFRPPAIQVNYFNFSIPNARAYRYQIIPNLYYKMIGVDGFELNARLIQGIPTTEVHSWFFSL